MRCQPTVSFNIQALRYDRRDMIPVTAEQFRQVMRRWASTVNIVTTRHDGLDYGLTVTAFSSLAATPPLVFASIIGWFFQPRHARLGRCCEWTRWCS